MAAGKTNLKIEYGSDWEFIALFPIDLSNVDVEVEILSKSNDIHEDRLLYITNKAVSKDGNIVKNQTSVSPVEYSIALNIDWQMLIRKLGSGNFHWRMYFNYNSGLRELVLGGKFSYKETV